MVKNIFLMLEKWVKFHLGTRTRDQEILHDEILVTSGYVLSVSTKNVHVYTGKFS